MRIGHGYDVHRLVECRDLILGGVAIPYEKGLLGHSDADVLTHAVMDALLGAAALGDIGRHFPDNDNSYKNIDSMLLLEKVNELINEKGYFVNNIDAVVVTVPDAYLAQFSYSIYTEDLAGYKVEQLDGEPNKFYIMRKYIAF